MAILNKLFSWWMKKRIHQIELFLKYPHEVQQEWFEELVESAMYTEFGRRYDFESIRSVETFKQRVPVQDYPEIKSSVDRIMQGQQNIFWPTEIKWFAKSSGTTGGRSKFIPLSREALEECHYKGGKDMLSIYCSHKEDSEVFTGKTLMMGGSSQTIDPDNNTYHGDLSSIIIKNLPFWAEIRRTPNREIALMKDFEEKLELMADICSQENVTSISGVPSWNLILLNKILEKTGKKNISEIWPNLEVFFHGGVSFAPYRKQFESIISSPRMSYLETYNASEGFFGIEDPDHPGELILMLDYGIYYEFIPMEEWHSDHPKTISLQEVEKGQHYAVLISTNAGLWRYKIGDTVAFTSTNPYRIKVSGRTKHFINAFGEEVIIDNAEQALAHACKHTGAWIEEYTAAPVFLTNNTAGKHEWAIEFKRPPDELKRFVQLLDDKLKELNTDYEAKRKGDMALQLPLVHAVSQGTFYKWMKSRDKLGGQNKVPRLSNSREYLEDILRLEEITA
jgi:phenylacetate-coenzyme A ligase PaaK-like adenylate-forming protein